MTVTGVSLTPSSGSDISIPLPATTFIADLTRLQSDSAFLGQALATVPAGSYTKITLAVNASRVTYCTQLAPGTPGCTAGTIATVAGGVVAPTIPISLTLTSSEKTGLRVLVDMSKALTINASTQVVSAVNVAAANVFSATTLAPVASSLGTSQLDFIEDVTGVVSSVSGSTFKIATATRGTLSVSANSSTFYSPNCSTSSSSCIVSGQLASVDLALNKDGTFAVLDYDPLAQISSDWIEGVVSATPVSSTQFQIVTNDFFPAATGTIIGGSLNLGDRVTVNLTGGVIFGVDGKGLLVPADAGTFSSSNDTSVLRPGQTVAVRLTSFTVANGATPASATVNFVRLRFTRVAGTVSSATSNDIFIQGLPSYFGTTLTQKVQFTPAAAPQTAPTNFDGATDGTGLTTSDTVSIRALYFGPASATPYSAAKVRKN